MRNSAGIGLLAAAVSIALGQSGQAVRVHSPAPPLFDRPQRLRQQTDAIAKAHAKRTRKNKQRLDNKDIGFAPNTSLTQAAAARFRPEHITYAGGCCEVAAMKHYVMQLLSIISPYRPEPLHRMVFMLGIHNATFGR